MKDNKRKVIILLYIYIYYLTIYVLFSILPVHVTNLLVARGSSKKFCANRRKAGNLYVLNKSAALGVGGNTIFGI